MQVGIVGRPTGPEVDQLVSQTSDLVAGDVLPYEAIEVVARAKRGTSRFASVSSAYRSRVWREKNWRFRAIANQGYQLLDPHQRIDLASNVMRGAIKRINKSGTIAARTDRGQLTDYESRIADNLVRTQAALIQLHNAEARKLITKGGSNGNS